MNFYVLENPKTNESDAITEFFAVNHTATGSAPKCPACGGFTGMLPLLPPIKVEVETWGKRFGDIAFGGAHEILVSERFKSEFLKAGLTGLATFEPAQIVKIAGLRKTRELPPKYFLVNPVRSRAAVDRQASGIDGQNLRGCDECRLGDIKRLRRLVLEPGTWSGEDIFRARGLPSTIITSERFKKFCDRYAFSNCVLVDASRYHFDHFPWERS